METFLRKILVSLNSIEVKGKENMDYLLGAIMAVEAMLNQMTDPTEEVEETTDGR